MIKTYRANTNIAINVLLENNENLHVSFTPLSDGSSRYTTAVKEVQDGIERHYNFNSLFWLHEEKNEDENEMKPEENVEDEIPEENGKTIVAVNDVNEAKDYLADRYGISRTSLKSLKAIKEQATAHNIEFEGI